MLCLNFWMIVFVWSGPLLVGMSKKPQMQPLYVILTFCCLFAFLFNHVLTDIILQQQSYFVKGGTYNSNCFFLIFQRSTWIQILFHI